MISFELVSSFEMAAAVPVRRANLAGGYFA